MPQLALPGGKGRKEKYIRAEQKNRLERTRLELNHKFFDREAFKTKFRIDREKKLVLRAFDLVKRTSGTSDEGCPPSTRHDRDHEKSVVFNNGLRLTELRLNNWRHLEKDLHSFLSSIERDMEKTSPNCSQKESFQSQEVRCNLLMKGVGLKPTKRLARARSVTVRPRSPEQVSIQSESVYSYSYGSESEEESDDAESICSDTSSEVSEFVTKNVYNRLNPGSGVPPKKVTFVRPHTTGNLLRTRSKEGESRRSQTPSVAEDTTHFMITKGGVLMNTGGQYKNIGIKQKLPTNTAETVSIATPTTKRLTPSMLAIRLKQYQSEDDLPTTPGENVTSRSSAGRVFSPCSENSSVAFNFQDSPRVRSAPSPIGNFPKRRQLTESKANSRLGIFLPPEEEFLKRQHFSNRQLDGMDARQTREEEMCGWKSRLINGQTSHVHIRSMRSMANVLRAALAFSRKTRQSILTDMVKEKNFKEEKAIKENTKRKSLHQRRQASEMCLSRPPFGVPR